CGRGRYYSGEVEGGEHEIDRLDADEWNDDAADAIDQQVAPQQRAGADRTITHAFERQRDQRDDDQRVEDDRGENRALRGGQVHDVERLQLRIERDEHRRDAGEILRHVVGDREGSERTTRHQQLLADLDHLDQLGRVGIEIDHVARLARGLRAGVHGDADVGLGERGG